MNRFKKILVSLVLVFLCVNSYAQEIKTEEKTALEKRLTDQHKAAKNPFGVSLYRPTYILPFYYTASPDFEAYMNNTPNNQRVMNSEFKGQLSLLMPIVYDLFGCPNSSLELAYSQVSYWQVYANSQYFRETDYEPEVFVQEFWNNWLFRVGADHQSNGNGGMDERSWNRAYVTAQYGGTDWMASLKVWTLIFPAQSADLHNPDILYYLGRDELILSKKYGKFTFSIDMQNLESGLTRGFIEPTVSYQFTDHIAGYFQFFTGYGQSLLEYNHHTQAAGIGIAFNNWI